MDQAVAASTFISSRVHQSLAALWRAREEGRPIVDLLAEKHGELPPEMQNPKADPKKKRKRNVGTSKEGKKADKQDKPDDMGLFDYWTRRGAPSFGQFVTWIRNKFKEAAQLFQQSVPHALHGLPPPELPPPQWQPNRRRKPRRQAARRKQRKLNAKHKNKAKNMRKRLEDRLQKKRQKKDQLVSTGPMHTTRWGGAKMSPRGATSG